MDSWKIKVSLYAEIQHFLTYSLISSLVYKVIKLINNLNWGKNFKLYLFPKYIPYLILFYLKKIHIRLSMYIILIVNRRNFKSKNYPL